MRIHLMSASNRAVSSYTSGTEREAVPSIAASSVHAFTGSWQPDGLATSSSGLV